MYRNPGASVLDNNRPYFDAFSDWYEDERHGDYDELIEDLESDLVRRHVLGKDVLEVGCGAGLILRRIAPLADRAVGVDADAEQVGQAVDEGLDVVEGEPTALPFDANSFDVVYSFKVLAHLPHTDDAIDEMIRVTRPGGHLLLEFYNPLSLRYLGRRAGGPTLVSDAGNSGPVYTRWDHPTELRRRFPDTVEFVDFAGIRVLTPGPFVHEIPWIRQFVRKLEFAARDSVLRYFGGFLVAILRKKSDPGAREGGGDVDGS